MPFAEDGLLQDARRLSREQFVAQADHFYFAFSLRAQPGERGGFTTGSYRAVKRDTISIDLVRVGRMLSRVGLPEHIMAVVKSDRNPYRDRISVGRAATNDLVVPLPQLSKLHAHFEAHPKTGSMTLRDAGSTNGSFVNGRRIEVGVPVVLKPGDAVRMGPADGLFLDAKSLYELLKQHPSI